MIGVYTWAKLIKDITPISQINPAQYISKAGPVCAGSDTRYEILFILNDDTTISLSVSGKQASKLAKGMSGILTYCDNNFYQIKYFVRISLKRLI